MTSQFDYKEFVYDLSQKKVWCDLWHYKESAARLEFWNDYQHEILPALQRELDKGWSPITEVSPAGIKLNIVTKRKVDFNWGTYIIVSLATLGIGLIVYPIFELITSIKVDYAYADSFQVTLRRRSN